MTGLQFERMRKNMTQEELAAGAGLVSATVMRIETGFTHDPIASTLLACANVLECSIEALLKEHPNEGGKQRVCGETKIHNDSNALLAYKNATHSTFEEMGTILNLTKEGVRYACKCVPAKEKYISRLAAYEGIPVDEFCAAYLPGA